jgi:hypothetical protein
MAVNTNRFYRAEQISPDALNQLNAQLDTDAFRAQVDAIRDRYYQQYLRADTGRARSHDARASEQAEIDQLVLAAVGGSLPNGYNVSRDGYVQFANETPWLQQLAWGAAPIAGAQGASMALNALGVAGAGTAAPSVAAPAIGSLGATPAAAGPLFPVLGPGIGTVVPGVAAPAVAAGFNAGATIPAAATALGWRDKVGGFLSGDTAQAIGGAVDWATGQIGERRAEGVLAEDKEAADLRYQATLDLNATQRAEDLQIDADNEAARQARWEAEQDQRQTMWDASETQREPYRQAGLQSLARLLNRRTPTRTKYRSPYMG